MPLLMLRTVRLGISIGEMDHFRVLSGEEPEREYKENFTFTGIEDLLTEYEEI